ncbi:MAG: hypothetical protein U0166_07260 [Acidobacteriota bacterium]
MARAHRVEEPPEPPIDVPQGSTVDLAVGTVDVARHVERVAPDVGELRNRRAAPDELGRVPEVPLVEVHHPRHLEELEERIPREVLLPESMARHPLILAQEAREGGDVPRRGDVPDVDLIVDPLAILEGVPERLARLPIERVHLARQRLRSIEEAPVEHLGDGGSGGGRERRDEPAHVSVLLREHARDVRELAAIEELVERTLVQGVDVEQEHVPTCRLREVDPVDAGRIRDRGSRARRMPSHGDRGDAREQDRHRAVPQHPTTSA